MTQFATNAEFAARLGLTLTSAEQTRADTLLALASGLIQQETNQTISQITGDTLVIRSVYGDRLRLPERPVQSVASVVLTDPEGNATTVDTADYYLDLDELVRVRSRLLFPELTFGMWARGWLGPRWTMTVTYTHGFATIPELVKATCMEMVIRAWVNPGSVAREQVGDTMTVYDNMRFSPSGLLLTDTEKATLNDLLGRRHGSVTLR